MAQKTLKIPALGGRTRCLSLTVCANVEDGQGREKSARSSPSEVIFRARPGGHVVFVRAVAPQRGGSGHVHIDCAVKEYFGRESPPKTTGRMADAVHLLSPYLGREVSPSITGVFAEPDDSSAFVKKFGRPPPTEAGTIKVSLSRIEWKVQGSCINRLGWCDARQGRPPLVYLNAVHKLNLSALYLALAYSWIEEQYSPFCLPDSDTEGNDDDLCN